MFRKRKTCEHVFGRSGKSIDSFVSFVDDVNECSLQDADSEDSQTHPAKNEKIIMRKVVELKHVHVVN